MDVGKNVTVQERLVYTGMSDHLFDVGLGIEYNITVWAITHEGYGKGTRESFISYGDSKFEVPLSLILQAVEINVHHIVNHFLLFFSKMSNV